MYSDLFDISLSCIICDIEKSLDINLSLNLCCINGEKNMNHFSNVKNIRKGGSVRFSEMLDSTELSQSLFKSLLIFDVIMKWTNVC
jgi:hypothetical protein